MRSPQTNAQSALLLHFVFVYKFLERLSAGRISVVVILFLFTPRQLDRD